MEPIFFKWCNCFKTSRKTVDAYCYPTALEAISAYQKDLKKEYPEGIESRLLRLPRMMFPGITSWIIYRGFADPLPWVKFKYTLH